MSEEMIVTQASRPSRKRLWLGLFILVALLALAVGAIFVRRTGTQRLADGRDALARSQWQAAAAHTNMLLSLKPAFLVNGRAQALGIRGIASYHLGEADKALTDINDALAMEANWLDLYAYRAELLMAKGEEQSTLADLDRALAADDLPEFLQAGARANRARLLFAANDCPAALADADAAMELSVFLAEEKLAAVTSIAAQCSQNQENAFALGRQALAMADYLDRSETAVLLMYQADYLLAQGNLTAASLAAEKALDAVPEAQAARLHQLRARIAYAQGDWAGATSAAELAVTDDASEAAAKAFAAWQAYRDSDFDAALSNAEAAIALDETNSLAQRVKGTILAWQGKSAEGETFLREAVKLDPSDVEAWAMLAYVGWDLWDFDLLKEAVGEAAAIGPHTPAGLWAQALQKQPRLTDEEERQLLDEAIALDDGRPELYVFHARTYHYYSDSDLVEADLEKARALNPDLPLLLATEIAHLGTNGKTDEMGPLVDELVELAPDWTDSYGIRAIYRMDEDDWEGAAADVEHALALNPNDGGALRQMGYVYLEQEDFEAARAQFERIRELNPESVSALSGLADVAVAEDDYPRALAYLDEALEKTPMDSDLIISKAAALLDQGRMTEGWRLINQVLAADPVNPFAIALKASLLIEAEQNGEVMAAIAEVIARHPEFAWAYTLRAQVMFNTENYDSAISSAELALAREPEDVDALRILVLAHAGAGDYDEALAAASQISELLPDESYGAELAGYVYNLMEDHEGVLNSMTKALSAETILSPALNHLQRGISYILMGDMEAARPDLEIALETAEEIDLVAEAEYFLAAGSASTDVVGNMKVVTDDRFRFQIAFPADWVQEPPDPATNVVVFAYDDSLFSETVLTVIAGQFAPGAFSAGEIMEFSMESAEQNANFELLRLGERAIPQPDADGLLLEYQLTFTDGRVRRGRQYVFLHEDGRLVVVTLEISEDIYEENVLLLDEIEGSFAFLP